MTQLGESEARLGESEALHDRVRRFATGESADDFDALALDIAEYQARWSPGFARLWNARKRPAATEGAQSGADSIPAVPSDAFRVTRVAVHPPELDSAHFLTSGTTTEARGGHPMRTTDTYEALSLSWGGRALMKRPGQRPVVVALAPDPGEPGDSSLGFMMRCFMQHFDGQRLEQRWLVTMSASGAGSLEVDVAGLRKAAAVARERREPLLVLATSFALVALLDALGDQPIAAPDDSVVMQTGGFKGRTREVDPARLRADVARAFGIEQDAVVGEYGMTELSSQLYEGTLPGGALTAERGVYLAPPWLRVTPVDPVHLEAVAEGEVGLARFVDLGNVDSAVAVVTQDLVRRRGPGIELLGRRQGAPPRGCSLAVEALVAR